MSTSFLLDNTIMTRGLRRVDKRSWVSFVGIDLVGVVLEGGVYHAHYLVKEIVVGESCQENNCLSAWCLKIGSDTVGESTSNR